MSANKLIDRIVRAANPPVAERFRQQLRKDGTESGLEFAGVMSAAVQAYMDLRACGDYEPRKR